MKGALGAVELITRSPRITHEQVGLDLVLDLRVGIIIHTGIQQIQPFGTDELLGPNRVYPSGNRYLVFLSLLNDFVLFDFDF